MAGIRIDNSGAELKQEPFEKKIKVQSNSVSLILLGIIDESEVKAEEKLFEALHLDGFHDIASCVFQAISCDAALIKTTPKATEVALSLSCPQFYIDTANSEGILLNQRDPAIRAASWQKEKKILRVFSDQSFWLPGGMMGDIDDLTAGMCIKFNHADPSVYTKMWWLRLDEICSSDQHDRISQRIAEGITNAVGSAGSYTGVTTLQLSSGIDSALMLAASEAAGVTSQVVNFVQSGLNDESNGAQRIAGHFGKKIQTLCRGPSAVKQKFSADTDISKYLEQMYPLLQSGTGMFIGDNISLLSAYEYGYHQSLENSAYATALCIQHKTRYPGFGVRRIKFDPSHGSSDRYRFSYKFLKSKMSRPAAQADTYKIGQKFPRIDPFYYEILEQAFEGGVGDKTGLLKAILPPDLAPMFQSALEERGRKVIELMLSMKELRAKLERPDPLTAQKLLKLLALLNNVQWSASKMHNYRLAGVLDQRRPGIRTQTLLPLLETIIDEKLVEYPKWHIFMAFKKISGRDFFSIRQSPLTPREKLRWLKKKVNRLSGQVSVKHQYHLNVAVNNRFSPINYVPGSSKKEMTPKELFYEFGGSPAFWLIENAINIYALEKNSTDFTASAK